MTYRVNFGNGQVHYAGSLAACERFIRDHGDGFTFLERYEPETGDWIQRCRNGRWAVSL